MRYLLDSNTCIVYLKNSSTILKSHLENLLPDDIAVCSVVKAELFYGAIKSRKVTENLLAQNRFFSKFILLPFDDKAARIYGNIRTQLEIRVTPIGPYDLQIASIAMANNLVLVTHNMREFSRIDGLSYEDWEEEERT